MSRPRIHDSPADRSKAYARKVRLTTLATLGDKCVRCGFTDKRALQIDHINGGGVKEHALRNRTFHLEVIKSFIANELKFQLLCANCNWIKRVENNETRSRQLI